jgi:hypothetical protein
MKEVSKIKHFFAWLFLGQYLPIDDKHNLRCSRCRFKMDKIKKGKVVIDVCKNCGGIFLDDDEINRLTKIGMESHKKPIKKKIKKVK